MLNLIHCSYSPCRNGKDAIEYGKDPVNRLFSRSLCLYHSDCLTETRDSANFQSLGECDPTMNCQRDFFKLLNSSYSPWRFSKLPIESGIVPVNKLFSRFLYN
jgi:hypothetical protein